MIRPDDIAPNVSNFEFYVEAFSELSSCRPSSFGAVLPIPFSAIVEYAKVYEVEDFHEFLDIIRAMDSELLRLENQKKTANTTPKKEPANGGKTNSGNQGRH
jgi:hypothetical protein